MKLLLDRILFKCSQLIRYLLIGLIQTLRPLLGPRGCCRFEFSCTDFAVLYLEKEPLFKALYAITRRLLFCNPFFYGWVAKR